MAAPLGPDPSVHRRRLRGELRKLREGAGFTQRDVALAMDWSVSKLIRVETGNVGISTNDLRALLHHYQITGRDQVDRMLEMAKAARERSWWSVYKAVASQEYIAFLGYECSAQIIRNFEPLLVPGLLQTEEYARELFKHIRGPKDPKRIEALVNLRMERQELLQRADPPQVHFIMDEAVIRRMVGGPDVMRRQLKRIRESAELEYTTIRVVPFSAGMYRSLRVPFVLFEFTNLEDEDVLYLEHPGGEMIVQEKDPMDDGADGPLAPATYLEVFWEMEQEASQEKTLQLLDAAISAADEQDA